MKAVMKYIKRIDSEIHDAKCYAEDYLYEKSASNTEDANRYKQMSEQELSHAILNHDMCVKVIEQLRKVYTPTEEMIEMWDKSHKEYVEKVAWIRQMLAM